MATLAQGSFHIRRFERLLQVETNPARQVLISQLLGDARARAGFQAVAPPGGPAPGLRAAA
ncbi:MAG TPA: hypothetical protein VGI79_19900 [Caulobacteraceae bacterium]|jgi:hypothetical protein